MTHLSDEQFVLHYYGEDGADGVSTERHLKACAECASGYAALARTLDAVTPPEFVEATPVDDMQEVRQMLHERLSTQPRQASAAFVALVWLVPLLYPLSFRALFITGQLAEVQTFGVPLAGLALAWACAGPFVALFALNRIGVSFERLSDRVFAIGAMLAAATPALFVFVARLQPGKAWWYGAIALVPIAALIRWSQADRSPAPALVVHRLSAAVITVFALTHVANQAIAFVGLSSYAAALTILREGYHQPAIEWLLLTSAAVQVFTGAAVGLRKVRAGAWKDNLQAISGWYLAMFLVTHVFLGMVLNPGVPPASASVIASTQFALLGTLRGAASVPFLLLGVAAFLFHVGVYARLVALAYLAEAQVRRLSYAAVFVGTSVVVTVGLALCGIHVR